MAFKIAELFAELKIKTAPFNKKISGIRKTLGLTNKKLRQFGQSAKKIGKSLAIFAGAGTAAFALLAKKVGDFDTTLQQTLNLLDEFDQEKFGDKLRAGVRKLAIETGRNLGDVSKALFDLISAGTGAEDALKQLRIGLKLSVASNVSAGTAIDALTTVQNSFKLSADKLALTSDFLFTINKAGKTTIDQLAASIGNVASDAAGADASIEDFGAAISTLTFAGIKTEITMTKLKSLFNELGKKGFVKNANDALKKYGITFTTTELKTSGLIRTLEKLGKLTRLQRQDLTGNSEALSAINTLLASQSKLQQDVTAQLNRAGATNKAFSDSSKTLGEQLNRLKAQFNDVFIEIGTNLTPAFNKLTPIITGFLKAIAGGSKGAFENLKKIVSISEKLIIVTTGLGLAFLALAAQLKIAFGVAAVGKIVALGAAVLVFTALMKKLNKELEKNARLQKILDRQGEEIQDRFKRLFGNPFKEVEKSAKSLLEKTRDLDKGFSKQFIEDTQFIQFNKTVKESLDKFEEMKRKLEEGTLVTLGFGKTKEQLGVFFDEKIKEIEDFQRKTKAQAVFSFFDRGKLEKDLKLKLEVNVAKKQLNNLIGVVDKFKNVFDKAKNNFNSNADKFKDAFSKTVTPIIDTFKTISSFRTAKTESERQERLEALTPEKASALFAKGLEGFKQEFSPDELLGKISDTIQNSSQASFVGLEDFQKNLQLSFLGEQDKKDKAIKANTDTTTKNTKALDNLAKKFDEAGDGGNLEAIMLALK